MSKNAPLKEYLAGRGEVVHMTFDEVADLVGVFPDLHMSTRRGGKTMTGRTPIVLHVTTPATWRSRVW